MAILKIKYNPELGEVDCNGDIVSLDPKDTPCVALDNGVLFLFEKGFWHKKCSMDIRTPFGTTDQNAMVVRGEFTRYAVGSMMEVKDV